MRVKRKHFGVSFGILGFFAGEPVKSHCAATR